MVLVPSTSKAYLWLAVLCLFWLVSMLIILHGCRSVESRNKRLQMKCFGYLTTYQPLFSRSIPENNKRKIIANFGNSSDGTMKVDYTPSGSRSRANKGGIGESSV